MNWDRVDRARTLARGLLCVGGFAVVLPVFLWIAAPSFSEPTFGGPPPDRTLVYAIGTGGLIFGVAWMWRIYRGPTKNDEALWRYRDH